MYSRCRFGWVGVQFFEKQYLVGVQIENRLFMDTFNALLPFSTATALNEDGRELSQQFCGILTKWLTRKRKR